MYYICIVLLRWGSPQIRLVSAFHAKLHPLHLIFWRVQVDRRYIFANPSYILQSYKVGSSEEENKHSLFTARYMHYGQRMVGMGWSLADFSKVQTQTNTYRYDKYLPSQATVLQKIFKTQRHGRTEVIIKEGHLNINHFFLKSFRPSVPLQFFPRLLTWATWATCGPWMDRLQVVP